jgi:RNA polymerase sigma-B factor
MADLSREDALLLEMRFSRDMTQAEIGEEVGISQAHVHRRLNSVMERLRHMFESVDV